MLPFAKKAFYIFIISFFCFSSTFSQYTITGRVFDKDNNDETLPGVNITIRGTSIGTISDINGSYTIRINENIKSPVLVFSYIGYKTQEINVEGRIIINVHLSTDALLLDELVVVGYGTQSRSNIVSAISSVEAEEMQKIPTTDVGEMLRGRAAGVQVTVGSASPGGSSDILIRGQSSLSGGNDPLIIVDGVPISNINDVNPSDIESLEVLKDASSQAIYGARAANGVILITTNRGKEGETQVTYNSYVGFQNAVNRNFDIYNGYEYAQLRREAYRTDNGGAYRPDEEIFSALMLDVLESGQFIDWEDEILRKNTIVTQHDINIRGGTDITKIGFSLGYFNNEGVLPKSNYERYNFRLNVDQKVNDWLDMGVNFYYYVGYRERETSRLNTFITPPIAKKYDDNGNLLTFVAGEATHFNPFINIEETDRESVLHKGTYNVFFDARLPFDVKYRLNASWRTSNEVAGEYESSLSQNGRGSNGEATHSTSDFREGMIENILTYDKKINKHQIDFTGVHSIIERHWGRTTNEAFGFPNDLLGWKGIAGAEAQTVSRSETLRRLVSFMGRARYNYDNKYILTLTARADASSVFGANNKWGYFPSAAIGWNAHQEDFLKDVSWLSQLKTRISYGQTGNEAISPYQSIGTASQLYYIFGDDIQAGFSPGTQMPNPDLKWETSTMLNVGLDFGLLKGRVQGSFEYYNNQTSDLLISRSLPGISGYSSMLDNVGRIENQGIELSVTGHIIDNKDLRISLTPIFTLNRNKVKELYGEVDTIPGGNTTSWLIVGEPVNNYYDFVFDGIWQENDDIENSHTPTARPGDIRRKDVNGDGEITEADRVLRSRVPDWIGSLLLNINYKNLDFSAELYTVQNLMRLNPYLHEGAYGGDIRGISNGLKRDYWTPENPSNTAPKPTNNATPADLRLTAYEESSYIRLRSMVLGYTFPEKWLNPYRIKNLRVYTSVTNPFTWMNFSSYSPERNPNSYPEAFTYNFGIKVTFL